MHSGKSTSDITKLQKNTWAGASAGFSVHEGENESWEGEREWLSWCSSGVSSWLWRPSGGRTETSGKQIRDGLNQQQEASILHTF